MVQIIYFIKSGKVKSNGECPIYAKIKFGQQSITMSVRQNISLKRWNFTNKLRNPLKLEKEKVIRASLDFIDSLVGPSGPTGSGSSSGPNTTNGIFTSNTVGQLTEWVVPEGVYTIEVWLNGSLGVAGIDVIQLVQGQYQIFCNGKSGGSFGSVTFILNVEPGYTISYYIGNNGVKGDDIVRGGNTTPADPGTDGETSQIYRNNVLGFNLSGGSDGQGGRYNGSGSCYIRQSGVDGSLNMTDCLENGFFPSNTTNPYSNQMQTLIIRY